MELVDKKAQKWEKQKIWRLNNKERWKEICKQSNENHKEVIREKDKQRYHATKHLRPPLTDEQRRIRSTYDRISRLKKKYDISLEDYDKMFKEQNGVCAICNKPELVQANLSVDHCHSTGRVRGLLCGVCNPAIGALGDSPELLERAISYLRKGM